MATNDQPPKTAQEFAVRAREHLDRKEFDAAITNFDKAIRLQPEYADAWNGRGLAKSRQEDYDGAIADFDEAIRLWPEFAEALNNRGFARSKNGEFDAAIVDYDAAIRLQPNRARTWNNRGFSKLLKEKFVDAIADFDEAIQLWPEFAEALNNRGLAKSKKGELDTAIVDYDAAIHFQPKHARTWNNRGFAKFLQGEFAVAIADFDEAIRLNPSYEEAIKNREAALAELQKDTQEDTNKSKYAPLRQHLQNLGGQGVDRVRMTFAEVEEILGFELPKAARKHRPWWANQIDTRNRPQARAWQNAGYETTEVDLGRETLVFVLSSKNLDRVRKATPLAERVEWIPEIEKIRVISIPMNQTDLWDVILRKLQDETTKLQNNSAVANSHAALVSVTAELNEMAQQHADSPQRVHDEIKRALSATRYLMEQGEIADDLVTRRFKEVLEECVLDIRGNTPQVLAVEEKRAALKLADVSDSERESLASATEEVIPYIEDEHIQEDMRRDVKLFTPEETQTPASMLKKDTGIYRWISRMSRMLPLLKEVAGFAKAVAVNVVSGLILALLL